MLFWVFKPTSGFMAEILLCLPKMLSFFLDISWDPEVVTRHRLHSLLEKYLDTRWRNVVAAAALNVHLLKVSCFYTDIRNRGGWHWGQKFQNRTHTRTSSCVNRVVAILNCAVLPRIFFNRWCCCLVINIETLESKVCGSGFLVQSARINGRAAPDFKGFSLKM